MALLEVEDIHTYIGPFYILQGVTFDAEKSRATVLLGRNGAGKTTTLRSIMGMTSPKSGKILFKGEELTKLPTYKIARTGIAYVPSRRRIFGYLTVEENIKLAFRGREFSFEDRLNFVLDTFSDLKGTLKTKARNLSGGQQKMLLIARAMINKNELLLIDEPTEGLSPILVKKFTETFVKLKKEVTIILVEQNFKLAREVGDICYILDMGRIVHHGSMEEVAENQELLKRHLGVSI
ncbi:MAG: ABC transporter ATP-binding protein [Candidatus Bathyarchaeota archaeon]|nr:ABC transporter ATP-binding protein [Candidatus Bathyarchaeota archaeon]